MSVIENTGDATVRAAPPGGGECGCGIGASAGAVAYVYALGRIQARFPSVAIEKELAQAVSRSDSVGLSDREAMAAALSQRANRYLARKLCWVMCIEGLETYLLVPRDPGDVDLLISSLRLGPHPTDVDVVIGVRGPIAPPEACNGLQVPIVVFDQVYSFDVDALLRAIPRPETIKEDAFGTAAEALFYRIMQLADNAGSTDEHRALNYLAVRYAAVYATVAQAHGRGESLSGVEVRPSRLSGVRNIVDVIFAFTNRQTDVVEKTFVRVDTTEEFPFLVSKMQPFYER